MNQLALQQVLKTTQTSAFTSTERSQSKDHSIGTDHHSIGQYIHFVSAQDELTESFELIKILRQHQCSDRWTLFIAPQSIPDKALLDCCSIDMNHVLVIREKQITSVMATIESALLGSTCSAIVAWSTQWAHNISSAQLNHIHQLAQKAQCEFYAFDKRKNMLNANNKTH